MVRALWSALPCEWCRRCSESVCGNPFRCRDMSRPFRVGDSRHRHRLPTPPLKMASTNVRLAVLLLLTHTCTQTSAVSPPRAAPLLPQSDEANTTVLRRQLTIHGIATNWQGQMNAKATQHQWRGNTYRVLRPQFAPGLPPQLDEAGTTVSCRHLIFHGTSTGMHD